MKINDRKLWHYVLSKVPTVSSPDVLFNSNFVRFCVFDGASPVLAYQFKHSTYNFLGYKVRISLSYGLHGIGSLLILKKPSANYFSALLKYMRNQGYDVFNITMSLLHPLSSDVIYVLKNYAKFISQFIFLADLSKGFKHYFSKAMNKKARNLVRKFRRHGTVRVINPLFYHSDIIEINRSFILKQGKLMFKHYIDPYIQYHAIRRLIEEGARLLLDPQGLMRTIDASGFIRLRRLDLRIPGLWILRISREEAEILANSSKLAEVIDYLETLGAEVTILTLGGEGALILHSSRIIRVPCYPVKVVDPTGAGDVFGGAFLVEFLRSQDLEWAAAIGSAMASLVVESKGFHPLLSPNIVEEARRRARMIRESIKRL